MARVNQWTSRDRSPPSPPPTTRTNVDTDAVTEPAPMDSSRAFPEPRARRAASWQTATTAPTQARNPSAAGVDSSGRVLLCGISSISPSRPTATAIEPSTSAFLGRLPCRAAASGTANTSVATLTG